MSTQNVTGSSFSSVLSTLEVHRHALTVLLPSNGAIQLQKNLYFRLRDLARVMTAPSTDAMGARESDFQEQLWLWAKGSGLAVLLLKASILTASLDKEVSYLSAFGLVSRGAKPANFQLGANSCQTHNVYQPDIGIGGSWPSLSSHEGRRDN